MYKFLLLLLILMFQSVWSIQINKSKTTEGNYLLSFSHIPAKENIGALKTHITFSDNITISSIITDAPSSGAWSQIKPVLLRKNNSVEIVCLGPAMKNSQSTESIEMFSAMLNVSGNLNNTKPLEDIIDSLWFSECYSTEGAYTIPHINLTSSLKHSKELSNQTQRVQHRTIGRTHSLTFNLAKTEMIKVTIIDLQGKIITNLSKKKLTAGIHTVKWPDSNQQIATGTYFIQLEINNFTYNKKVNYFR